MDTGRHLGKGTPFPTVPEGDKLLRLISGRWCPYGHRVHLVLDTKEIPYHTIYCDLLNKPEWLFERSPLGKIPALELPNEDGCPAILDSMAICEYLDDKYPQNPVLSRDPLKKYYEKNLMEKFGPVGAALYKVYMLGPEKAPGCIEDTEKALEVYDKELESRNTPFFAGDKPGWVDFMIWPWIERMAMIKYLYGESNDVNYGKLKNFAKWIESMKEVPAVKDFMLDGETHAKYAKSKADGNPDNDMLLKQ
ncbi:pyrimidodiazepine synthase-like isoform X1 [Episyrphus balteatus]|uniref:pyrimidodiazepine synthase-like isoform X1 n=1 Tax=Episyrphus balteatus TaxID=286459 RepID=UPI0024869CCE|nr:pyrimidodiazepine synthase-like isoform X1 [Episyrphus balteatus]